jgi:chitodextrinase
VMEMRQQTEQQRQIAALQNHVSQQEARYVKEAPDYFEALDHVRRTSMAGIKALGYDDQTAAALAQQEFVKFAHRVASQGGDVAEHVYQTALANGYQPKQAGASEQDKIASLKKGTAAAKSLGSGGGVTNKLSLAALAEMPADEFAKTIGDDEAWRKLWG